jgi:hypothetical protein
MNTEMPNKTIKGTIRRCGRFFSSVSDMFRLFPFERDAELMRRRARYAPAASLVTI